MSDMVHCVGCGVSGWRKLSRFAPFGWRYFDVLADDRSDDIIEFVCSTWCASHAFHPVKTLQPCRSCGHRATARMLIVDNESLKVAATVYACTPACAVRLTRLQTETLRLRQVG